MTKNAKSDFYLSSLSDSGGNSAKFWKTVKCMIQNSAPSIPQQIISTTGSVTDNKKFLNVPEANVSHPPPLQIPL